VIKHWLRKLRGVLGIGTLWGAAGVGIGCVASVLMSVSSGNPALSTLLAFCLGWGGLGFVLGSTFAAYGPLDSAAGTVALAKRAPAELKPGRSPDDPHLLEHI
jgi:uncharacterized membrane protein